MEGMKGDEAFYYHHNGEGNLKGMILSHLDDFIFAGTDEFMKEITDKIKEKLDGRIC